MSPVFSIIIPAFNAEKTLRETLDSIAEQDFLEYEVILVDDGSTDHTAEVFKNWQKYHPSNTTLISQENQGLGKARNVASQHALGEWLVFLDADDLWVPNKLSQLHQTLVKYPEVQWIYHPVWDLFESGKMKLRRVKNILTFEEFIQHNPFTPSAVALKKEAFKAAGEWEERTDRVEDLGLWIRLFTLEVSPFFLPHALTKYRVYSGVTTQIESHIEKVMNVWNEMLADNVISNNDYQRIVLRKNYEAARQCHKSGQFKLAKRFYKNGKKSLKSTVFILLAELNFIL